jgi:hypothetical protein
MKAALRRSASTLRAAGSALRAAGSALRGFLAGFTGMPSARLPARCPHAAREALGARSARRPTCC